MAEENDEETARAASQKADSRQARLEQALRVNLLKRKAKSKDKAKVKAGKASERPPEEGGQAEG